MHKNRLLSEHVSRTHMLIFLFVSKLQSGGRSRSIAVFKQFSTAFLRHVYRSYRGPSVRNRPYLACVLFLARIVDDVMCLGRFTTLIRPDEVVCPCCRRSYRRSRLEEREVTGVGMQSNIATHGMGPVPLRAIICKSCFQAIHPFDRIQRPCCHAAFPRSFGPSPRLSFSSFGLFNSRSGVTAWSFLACP